MPQIPTQSHVYLPAKYKCHTKACLSKKKIKAVCVSNWNSEMIQSDYDANGMEKLVQSAEHG